MAAGAAVDLKVLISIVQDSQGTIKSAVADFKSLYDSMKNLEAVRLQGLTSEVNTFIEKLEAAQAATKGVGESVASGIGQKGVQEVDKFAKKTEESTAKVLTLDGAVGKLTSTIKFLAGGFLALESVRFIKDLADTAARTEVLSTVLHVVGNNAGYTVEYLDSLDKSVQSLGITAQSSRQSLTQLIQAGLDPGLATGVHGLARAAQDLAVIGGINSSEAFQRMISAIERGYTQELRYLGINVSLAQAQERYAQTLHKTAGELSAQEKTQALANEVLRKGAELSGTYEKAMGDVGKQLTSLPRYTEELANATGERLLPVYRVLIQEYTTLLENVTTIIQAQTAQKGSSDALANSVQSIATVIRQGLEFLVRHADTIIFITKAYLAWRAALLVEGLLAGFLTGLTAIVTRGTQVIGFFKSLTTATEVATVATKAATVAQEALTVAETGSVGAGAAAAASLTATGAVAGEATAAISAVALAWTGIAALFAIPIIGYVLVKFKQQYDLKKDTIYEALKKAQLESPSRNDFFGAEEVQKQQADAQNAIYDALLRQKEVVAGLDAEYKKLENTNETTAKAIAKTRLEAAQADEEDLRRRLDNLNVYQTAANKLIDARDVEDKAKLKLAQLPTTPHTNIESQKATQDYTEAHAKVVELQKKFQDLTEQDRRTDQEKAAALEEAKTNQVKRELERREQLQEDSTTKLLKAVNITGGVVTDKAFTEDLGNWKNLIDNLDKSSERFKDRLAGVREGLKTVGAQVKQPEDLANFIKTLDAYKASLSKAGVLTRADLTDIQKQIGDATLQVRNKRIQENVLLNNEAKNNLKANQGLAEERLKADLENLKSDLDLVKSYNAAVEVLEKERYTRGELSLDEYYKNRATRIRTEGQAEIDLQKEQVKVTQKALDNAQAELTQAIRQGQTPAERTNLEKAVQTQVTAVATQQSKLKLLVGAGGVPGTAIDQPLSKEGVQYRADEKKALEEVKTLQEQVAAFYAGETKTNEQIIDSYEKKLKTLGGIAGAEKAVREAEAVDVFKNLLANENKELENQIALQQANLDLQKSKIQYGVAIGQITDIDAQRQETQITLQEIGLLDQQIALRNNQLTQLQALKSEREAAGDNVTGLSEQILTLEKDIDGFQVKVIGLMGQIKTYGQELQRSFSQSLATAISDSLQNVKDAGNAFLKLGNSIKANVAGIIGKNISDRITGLIVNQSSDKDAQGKIIPNTTIFDKIFGFIGLGNKGASRIDGSSENQALWVRPVVTAEGDFSKGLTDLANKSSLVGKNQSWASIFSGVPGDILPRGSGFDRLFQGSTIDKLAKAFGSLFGGGAGPGAGSLPMDQWGSLFFGSGGDVSGPGTGTSDSILARVSDGEYIMPADKTQQWRPMLEAMRLGKYALGGMVGEVQSIAISPVVPRRFAAGGMVMVTDGGASVVTPGGQNGNLTVQLHPDALNMTLRDWLDHEVTRQFREK